MANVVSLREEIHQDPAPHTIVVLTRPAPLSIPRCLRLAVNLLKLVDSIRMGGRNKDPWQAHHETPVSDNRRHLLHLKTEVLLLKVVLGLASTTNRTRTIPEMVSIPMAMGMDPQEINGNFTGSMKAISEIISLNRWLTNLRLTTLVIEITYKEQQPLKTFNLLLAP